MQWITLVPEDAGVQRLKADNRRPVITRNVDAVSPYPSAHALRIGEGNRRESAPHGERRADERRAGAERRKQQVPVLLDTRSKHDRRAIDNRRTIDATDNNSDQRPRRVRLNLYA
ncbi:hypothetical protein DFR30_2739 [Thiogranum longum]|uniref:Uncharacterized protein n=1 Tax=Thiogranum longum TaxID=1537524 RepID=A0A4R1HD56_9GAMM|nr:hypothetical protein [Thiogranum longum]TCK19428.1 hypothetical protein DFR30_2739 [Thiogranum longum]